MSTAAGGPRTAVEEVQGLFLRHAGVLRGFVLGLLPDANRAEDVFQELFLTVTRKAADFRPGTNFLAWARSIARLMTDTVQTHFDIFRLTQADAWRRIQPGYPLSGDELDAQRAAGRPLRHLAAQPLLGLLLAVLLGHVAELPGEFGRRRVGAEVVGVVRRGGRDRGRDEHRNEREDVPTKSHSLDLRGE